MPMFWHRREPWDPFNMDSFFSRPFDSHFRDMARIMDGLRQRPFYLEDYVRPKEVAEALAKSEIAEVSLIEIKTLNLKICKVLTELN